MAIIQDWKIRSTSARCEVTGEAFHDGEEFYTCIFEDLESDGFLRRDYSVAAWSEIRKNPDPAPFSFWKSVYKAPEKAEVDRRVESTSVEGMLRRFIEEDDPVTENARYILALMLERKKSLLPTDAKETETRTLLFYEHAESGDVFIVADPGLRLDEVESVQREVVDLLSAEEKRLADASQEIAEAADEVAEDHEDETDEGGDNAPETEEEPVAVAGHKTPGGLGLEPFVDAGEELADGIEGDFENPEADEEPSAPDDKPES